MPLDFSKMSGNIKSGFVSSRDCAAESARVTVKCVFDIKRRMCVEGGGGTTVSLSPHVQNNEHTNTRTHAHTLTHHTHTQVHGYTNKCIYIEAVLFGV